MCRRSAGNAANPIGFAWTACVACTNIGPAVRLRNLGFSLLQDAVRRTLSIAEQAGIRALLTHPIDTSADAFYRRFGFEPTPEIERQLILLLKDARRFVS